MVVAVAVVAVAVAAAAVAVAVGVASCRQASKQASQQASKQAKVASNDSEVHDKLGKVHKPVAAREHPPFNKNALSVPPALLTRFHTPWGCKSASFFR